MGNKRRVYCKNCRWCRHREWALGGFLFSCWLYEVRGISYMGYKTRSLSNSDCEKHNENCDCKDYVRSWWKFWVWGNPSV